MGRPNSRAVPHKDPAVRKQYMAEYLRRKLNHRRREVRLRKNPSMVSGCRECGGLFSSRIKRKRFCSEKCYQRDWRRRNVGAVKAQAREWRLTHSLQVSAQKRAWREKNRERIRATRRQRQKPLQPCGGCGGVKPRGQGKRYCEACEEGRRRASKDRVRAYNAKFYAKHRSDAAWVAKRRLAASLRGRLVRAELKAQRIRDAVARPCQKCGAAFMPNLHGGGHEKRCCSVLCQCRARRANNPGQARERYRQQAGYPDALFFRCQACGVEALRGRTSQIYCSRACGLWHANVSKKYGALMQDPVFHDAVVEAWTIRKELNLMAVTP